MKKKGITISKINNWIYYILAALTAIICANNLNNKEVFPSVGLGLLTIIICIIWMRWEGSK